VTSWPLLQGAKLGHDAEHESHSDSESHAEEHSEAEGTKSTKVEIPHVPHLLDFHDLRRPECLSFWITMALCFGIGFIPRSKAKLDT